MGASMNTSVNDQVFALDFDAAVLMLGMDHERRVEDARQMQTSGTIRRKFGVS